MDPRGTSNCNYVILKRLADLSGFYNYFIQIQHTGLYVMLRNQTYATAIDTMGDTPLIKLNRVIPDGGATVYVKCEFFNPLNSVKDRIGVAMIRSGEESGDLNPDTHVVEPTSGIRESRWRLYVRPGAIN